MYLVKSDFMVGIHYFAGKSGFYDESVFAYLRREIMMKSRYRVIANPLEGYDFSFERCHAAEIGAYIIGVLVAVLISTVCICNAGWSVFVDNIYIPLCCSLPLILGGLSMTFSIRKVKKIITEGQEVEGEIVSYKRKRVSHKSHLVQTSNYTVLHVKFYHNGEQQCTVGAGHKLPEEALASHRCTVYILNDKVFVTGFKLRKKGEPKIEFKLIEHSIYDD